mgnify:CR=1 FL=1
MKSLFKSILKFIYCIVLPAAMLLIMRTATTDWSDEVTGVSYWVLVISTIAVCLNGIFWFAIMSNTRMIPKRFIPRFSTEMWKGIGMGFGMQKRGTGVLLVLPFIVIEFTW